MIDSIVHESRPLKSALDLVYAGKRWWDQVPAPIARAEARISLSMASLMAKGQNQSRSIIESNQMAQTRNDSDLQILMSQFSYYQPVPAKNH